MSQIFCLLAFFKMIETTFHILRMFYCDISFVVLPNQVTHFSIVYTWTFVSDIFFCHAACHSFGYLRVTYGWQKTLFFLLFLVYYLFLVAETGFHSCKTSVMVKLHLNSVS